MADARLDPLFVGFQEALAGRYSLERELGRGGMGVVYLAREVRLDRPVAIKLLPPELAANATLRERFIREARTAARLSHPYIVPIHSVDEAGGFVFYVMAYVDGETVAERVRRHGPLPPAEVTRIMREVAWALAYAHAQGVVHRDIKPANIMLERGTERAMVMDFGIARLASASGETAVGEVLGTPEYMSPEQACGEAVDGRSDLYSLGIAAYFMLSGGLPFSGEPRALLAKHITQPAAPVASVARGAPRALSVAVDRCLAKSPADRFPTGEALADALAQSLEKRAEIPVPLRVFLDRRRAMLMAMPAAFGFPLLMNLLNSIGPSGPGPDKVAMLVGIGAAMLLGPIVVLVRRLRHVMRQGYGPEDIATALRVSFDRRREEFVYEFGQRPGRREQLMRLVSFGGLALGAAALLLLPTQGKLIALHPKALGMLAFVGLYAGVLSAVIGARWRALREGTGPRLARFWQGPVGRLLGRIAGRNLPHTSVNADRPTELGIAMSAEALFDALPKDQRKALGDIPEVLRGLEAHARAMRTRITDLDASLVDAQRTPARTNTAAMQETLVADLRAARAAAEQRLAEVVTALETLRLDLLRLQAGAGSAESITQSLLSARALGDDVDRLVAGQREVESLVKAPQEFSAGRRDAD